MNNSLENLLRNILKRVAPNYEILKLSNSDKNISVESSNKVDIYNEYVRLLMEQLFIKQRKIEELTSIDKHIQESNEQNTLYILDIKEQVLSLQLECLDLEIEIMAKKYYSKIYSERITEYKDKQKRIYDESKIYFKEYVDIASNFITFNDVSQKDKQILSGIISQYHKGIKEVELSNQLYIQLKDHVHRIDIALSKLENNTPIIQEA